MRRPAGVDDAAFELALAHTNRFRKVATRYPRRVNEAYGFDQARALADDDVTVAATVAAWELVNGLTPRNWLAIGRAERGES